MFLKKFFLAFLTITIYNCAVSQNYNIKYNDIEPSERQKVVISEIKKENEVMLFFDGGFNEDRVTINVNGNIVSNDMISTDNTIGSAKSYTFSKKDKKIIIILNENKINLKFDDKYPFISVDLVDGKPIIEYRKVYKSYK